jgi:WD40 repeat protein
MTRSALEPGAAFAGLRVMNLLGRGGMGAVYEAEDSLGRRVALKVMSEELARDEVFLRRFEREARAAAAIAHRNVAKVHRVGTERGLPFVVLELLRGGSLRDRLRRGPLPWHEAARFGANIARALEAVHATGLVHRDLKPENVLLDDEDRPKLTDFGLVRFERDRALADDRSLTKSGELVGTLEYLAPEQANGQRVGPPADLYSLGATLHMLLTGTPPFDGRGYTLVKKHLMDRPTSVREMSPEVPERFAALVLRLLSKEPEQRGQAADIVRELDAIAAGDISAGHSRAVGALLVFTVIVACGIAVARAVRSQTPKSAPASPTAPATPQGGALRASPSPTAPPEPPPPWIWGELGWSPGCRIHSIAFSPDGATVAFGCDFGHLQIMDMKTRRVRLVEVEDTVVFSLAFLDETRLVAGTWKENENQHGELSVWNVSTGERLSGMGVDLGPVPPWSLELLPGKERVLVAGSGSVLLVPLAGGPPQGFPDPGEVFAVAFAPDSGRVFAASGDGIRFWDVSDPARAPVVLHVGGDPRWEGRSIAVTRDGKTVLTGSQDGRLALWDVARPMPLAVEKGHDGDVRGVAFLPDGRAVSAGGCTERIWRVDAAAGRLVFEVGHESRAQGVEDESLALAPGGRLVLTGDNVGDVRFWYVTGDSSDPSPGVPVARLAVSPDGQRVFAGRDDGRVTIHDSKTGAVVGALERHAHPVLSLAVSPRGDRVLTGTWGEFRVWDLGAGTHRAFAGDVFDACDTVSAVAFAPENRVVVAAQCTDEKMKHAPHLQVWDLGRGEPVSEPWPIMGAQHVNDMAFVTSEHRRLLTASWSATQGSKVFRWRLPELDREGMLADSVRQEFTAVATDGRRVLVGRGDGNVEVRDLDSENVVLTAFALHSHKVTSVALTPTGKVAITHAETETVKVWEVATGAAPWKMFVEYDFPDDQDAPKCFALEPQGAWFVVGTARGRIHKFNLVH